MRLRLSLTTRLTLLFASISAALLLGFASLIGSTIESHFADLDNYELEGKLLLVRHEIERIDSPAALTGLPGQLHDALVGHPTFCSLSSTQVESCCCQQARSAFLPPM